ncbi:MAG: TolC family protein [Phycisphaerae bacterium]|nr:TolC family protein [Phycisphaerae bacterium]
MLPTRITLVAGSLGCWALASCTAIEHGTELQQAQQRMDEATGRRPAWAVDLPLKPLAVPAGGEVTADAAIELALMNNRTLRADLEAMGQAKAELVQAGLLANPMLTIMLRFPEAGGRASLDFGLARDFADLWLIPSRKRAAAAILQQKLLSFTDNAIALVRDVSTTYIALQYLDRAIELQTQNLEVLQQSIDVAQARLRSGSTTQLDVNLLESRRLQAELELLQLRNDRRTTQLSLLRLMGLAQSSAEWRAAPLPVAQRDEKLNEEALIDWGLQRRLDIQAAGWEVDAALADFQQQKLRLIQSLGVGISGERFERRGIPGRNVAADAARASIANGRLTAPEIEPRSVRRAERRQEIDLVLGPVIEVPLPVFDQNQAQIARTQYRARELHERYSELEQRTVEQIRSGIVTFQTAIQRRNIYQTALLPVQESNLQVAETAYQSGQETILTVLLAQQDLIQARLGLAAAIRDELTARASLERELGGRLPRPEELAPTTQPTPDGGPSTQPTREIGVES